MNPIFHYLNFREFLRDYYEEKKRQHSFYSFRLFSQKAGFQSPNFLKLVIDDKRNLSKESVFKFAKALALSKQEAEYFENLVFFNQSDTLEQKNEYLSRLMKFRKKTEPGRIEESELEYYSAWYHPAIRELVTAVDFGDDYRKLGRMVVPAINAEQAQASVALLCRLEFIRRDERGRYRKTSVSLTTGAQIRSVAVANYHRHMMRLGAESLERFGVAQRDISSLTLSVSTETFRAIKDRITMFRRELLELAEADTNSEIVTQVNFQLFPLSERIEENGGKQ